MFFQDVADLPDGLADGLALAAFPDAACDQVGELLPPFLVDPGIDTGVGQDPDLALEDRNEKEDSVLVLGFIQFFGEEGCHCGLADLLFDQYL